MALYCRNYGQIQALEGALAQYGYRDLYAPLPPENPLDMLELAAGAGAQAARYQGARGGGAAPRGAGWECEVGAETCAAPSTSPAPPRLPQTPRARAKRRLAATLTCAASQPPARMHARMHLQR